MKAYIAFIDTNNMLVKIIQILGNDLCLVETEEGAVYQRYYLDLQKVKVIGNKIEFL